MKNLSIFRSIVAVCLVLLQCQPGKSSFRCNDRTPEGRFTPKALNDHRFQIKISGNPSSYETGEKYTGKNGTLI